MGSRVSLPHLAARRRDRANLLRRVLHGLDRVRLRCDTTADHDLDEIRPRFQLFSGSFEHRGDAVSRATKARRVPSTTSRGGTATDAWSKVAMST